MASNPTPDNTDVALALAEDMADGLTNLEVSVGVKQNTAASMRAAITLLRAKELEYNTCKDATGAAEAAVAAADEAAKGFIGNASKALKIMLGNKWSLAWEPTGFPDGKTRVPLSQDKRLTLLASLSAYYTAQPDKEAASLGITAAQATLHFDALSNARDTAAQKLTMQKTCKTVRDNALDALRVKIRGTIAELSQLLGADDPRWDAFGLNRPSDPDIPLPASVVTLTAMGTGNVLVTWNRGKRATRYRIFGRYTGEAEFYQMALVHDLSHTLTGLTTGETLEIKIIAANETAEAAPTETVSVVVG